jgi:hypothetical protein
MLERADSRGEESPDNVTLMVFPPTSIASSWRGWCMSPTKWITNLRASNLSAAERDVSIARVVLLDISPLSNVAATETNSHSSQ